MIKKISGSIKRVFVLITVTAMILTMIFGCSDKENPASGGNGAPDSGNEDKIILTMVSVFSDYRLENTVAKFNVENDIYYIDYKDYSEYITDDNILAGQTKLIAEITSGFIPDIINLEELPFIQWAYKGFFEDLYPFIDADLELSCSDIIENVIRLSETDGALYRIATEFSVDGLIGHPSVLGESMGWTMDEFIDVIADNPNADIPLGAWFNKVEFLWWYVQMNPDLFINRPEGVCNFDSDDFIRILTLINNLPRSESSENTFWIELITQGRQIIDRMFGNRFLSIKIEKAIFGGEIVYKGFPMNDGIGNILSSNNMLAMSSACADKDGAWEFIRTFFTEDWQRENSGLHFGFPTNKTVFLEKAEEVMTPEYETDSDGNSTEIPKGTTSFDDGTTIELYALTQDEVDQIIELVDTASFLSADIDRNLGMIVYESAANFFAGVNTAEDTARIIQNRVSIYLSEQNG